MPIFPVKDEPNYLEFLEWTNNLLEPVKSLDEDKRYLRYLCEKNFNKRTKGISDDKLVEYHARVEEELDVLEFHGFCSYMLIVADYISWARNNGIAVGDGRGCLAADGLILTENGYKKIINVNVGEKVYTHTGELHSVINKFEFDVDNNEDCVRIKTQNSYNDLVFTKNHKLFACKSELTEQFSRLKKGNYKSTNKVKKYKSKGVPTWIPISDLSKDDFVYVVFPEYKPDVSKVPLKINVSISSTRNSKLDIIKEIPIDDDFIYMLGRWVGDGWWSIRSDTYDLGFAFHSDDIVSINWFKNYFERYGFHCGLRHHKSKKLVQLIISNLSLINAFKTFFTQYQCSSYTKHFPNFFRNLDRKQLHLLLKGYSESDGSKEMSSSSKFRQNFDTVSDSLVLELREILFYLHIKSYVNIRKPYILKPKNYNCKQSYKTRIIFEDFNSDNCSNGYFAKIVDLQKVKCNKVYDITVEKDHSYLTQNLTAHNSVGGSLVAFLLGIHQADPIKYNLIFARFHNKEKSSFPDIDTDFAPSGRDKVQEYLRVKYGSEHVAHVSNINTITPKVFVRDIARACELGGSRDAAVKVGNDVADCISSDIHSIDDALIKVPLFSEYCKKYPEFIKFKNICGKYRAFSTHAGGIIISQRPLTGLVPLRKDKDGSLAIEYDKEKAEDNGLVKMDMLGLSTLDIIGKTHKLINESNKVLPLETLNYEDYDQVTYDLISSGDTFNVFQLGTSGGTVDLCKRIKPKNINDIANINALARPSAKDMRNDFILTRDGKKPMTLLHPSLQRGFGSTYGFGLYEECLMYLAQDVAGWSLHEADRLRKLTKEKGKNPEKARKWRLEFIAGAIKNGINEEIAKRVWDEVIEKFSGYGFNKSLYFLELVDVYTFDGKFIQTKSINEILRDDYVRSRDEITKQDIFVKVLETHDHGILPLVEIELTTGEKIKCTMNHKFRVEDSYSMVALWEIIRDGLTIVVQLPTVCKFSSCNGKIKSVKYIGDYQTYDLEVDHKDHQFYLSNGVLTSNSHAVLYSMISYETAYLKAHYPIEFLLANLMHEVNSNAQDAKINIEKTKQELRSRKVKIIAPHINESLLSYTITDGNKLITGLDALKFVGEEAIADILEKRPFTSFFDFMARVDSKKVRANNIQALAASGSLDVFGIPRKLIFLYCSDYRKKLQVWCKKHDPTKDKFIYPWTNEGEWSKSELYALEQFYLGESFVCKPHEAHGKFFAKDHNVVKDIKKSKDKTTIPLVIAIVKDFFEFKVKKEGSKYYGQSMIKAVIEDMHGEQCSCTIFPDRWQMVQERLKYVHSKAEFDVGIVLSFSGNVNTYDDNTGIILDNLHDVSIIPALPVDLKAKKINLKEAKSKTSPVAAEKVGETEGLLEQIEDELFDAGLIDLDEDSDD